MEPSLSLVIPSHCRVDLLRRCLASVCRHAPTGTEVLVVDDASPGGAVTAAAREFPGVRCLRLQKRRGFCAAVNAGLRVVGGEIIELLNDDTEVAAGWAEGVLTHFADPGIAAVAPLVLQRTADHTETPRIDSAGDRYHISGIAGKRGHGQTLRPEHLQSCPVFGASASSAFYRRQALLEVGLFPESFGAYFEDVDLSFRLHWAGYRVIFEPASRVWHRVGSSHRGTSRQMLEQQSRNEERVFWRNLPRSLLWRALPLHLAVLAGKAWRRWRRGELLPFVLGRLSLLAEVRQLVEHRQRLAWRSESPAPHQWELEDWRPRACPVETPVCR